jgi:hypothetical protein
MVGHPAYRTACEFLRELVEHDACGDSASSGPRYGLRSARLSLAKLFAKAGGKVTLNALIHEAIRVHGYTLQETADTVDLHYTTVSRIAEDIAVRNAMSPRQQQRSHCFAREVGEITRRTAYGRASRQQIDTSQNS